MYFIRRLFTLIPLLVVIMSLAFLLIRLVPGGPFDRERKPASPEIERQIAAKYHLNEPIWKQYLRFLRDIAHGDFGPSLKYRNHTVTDIIGQGLPVSMMLGVLGFGFAMGVGLPLGYLTAVWRGRWVDYAGSFSAILLVCIPGFVIAPLLVMLFAIKWHLLPVALWASPWHAILPMTALGLFYSGRIARLMREGMLNTMQLEFITAARAKGLGENTLLLKHAFRLAVLPVVSYAGPLLADLLTGSFVVETIFQIPGIGAFFVNGLANRDLTMMMGLITVYAVLLIVLNLLVDLAYTFLDRESDMNDQNKSSGVPDGMANASSREDAAGSAGGHLSPNQRAWRRFRKNRPAVVSGWFLLAITAIVILYPFLSPFSPEQVSDAQFQPPNSRHWLGTDVHGRDLLVRLCYGAQISLMIGAVGACVCLVIGVSWGAIAGYSGGRTDDGMMRIVDALYCLPSIILAMVLISSLEPFVKHWLTEIHMPNVGKTSRLLVLLLALGAVSWLTMARIVRGQVLSLRSRQFVDASRALGAGPLQILRWHIIPNVLGVVIVYLTLSVPTIMLSESFLSFLGMGIQPPMASWGSLIAEGAEQINPIRIYWWLIIFPGGVLVSTLLALNFLGDGLRDAWDVRGN